MWAKINLFKFFRLFFRIFCALNIGCPDDPDVSLKLKEIFDSSAPRNSTSIKLYTDSLTNFFEALQDAC